jgi:hypothetical protein
VANHQQVHLPEKTLLKIMKPVFCSSQDSILQNEEKIKLSREGRSAHNFC